MCRPSAECCAAVQTCSRCLQSPSGWRPVQRELLQTFSTSLFLVLSSDTAPATAPHRPPGFLTTCVPKSSRPWKLAPLRLEDLTLTSSRFRERGGRGGSSAMFCVAGEGMGLCLANLASLILSSSKQGHRPLEYKQITSQSENVGLGRRSSSCSNNSSSIQILQPVSRSHTLHQTLLCCTHYTPVSAQSQILFSFEAVCGSSANCGLVSGCAGCKRQLLDSPLPPPTRPSVLKPPPANVWLGQQPKHVFDPIFSTL